MVILMVGFSHTCDIVPVGITRAVISNHVVLAAWGSQQVRDGQSMVQHKHVGGYRRGHDKKIGRVTEIFGTFVPVSIRRLALCGPSPIAV